MAILKIRDNDGKITEIPALKGPQGPQGAPGKSAYEYAKDGGYTGTEEEFAEKLANECSGSTLNTSHALYPSLGEEFEKTVHFTAKDFFYLYVERVWDGKIEYYNGTTWVEITNDDPGYVGYQKYDGFRVPAVEFPWGYTVYVRGKGNTTITAGGVEQWKFLREPTGTNDNADLLSKYSNAWMYTDYTGEVYGGGNVKYLLDYEIDDDSKVTKPISLQDGCFAWMFYNYSYPEIDRPYKLMTAPALPTIEEATVSARCYQGMFALCKYLKTPPAIPNGTNLSSYQDMFLRSGVTRTPKFCTEDTVAMLCYRSMFENCTDLVIAEELPAITLELESYLSMFYGCTSLVTPPVIRATHFVSRSCAHMFGDCINLQSANFIKDNSKLEYQCFYYMFAGCKSLTSIPEIHAEYIRLQSCYNMFVNCSNIHISRSNPGNGVGYTITSSDGKTETTGDLSNMFGGTYPGDVSAPTLGEVLYLIPPTSVVQPYLIKATTTA